MKAFKFILIILISLASAYGAYYLISMIGTKKLKMAQPPPLVEIAKVEKKKFEDRIEAIGTANARESVNITASITEFVDTIHFNEGEYVEKDRLLVSLEQKEELAALSEIRLLLEDENREYKISRNLYDKKVVAQTEFDKQSYELKIAKVKLNAVEARIKKRNISAPFSGVTGIRKVSPGTLITAGTVITTLDDLSVIKLSFTVPETFIASLKPGMTVEAGCAAYPDKKFTGKISIIDSRVDPDTRAVTIQAEFPNPGSMLKPGMLMNIEIISNPREAVSIPEKALLSYAEKHFVYILGKDMTAERRSISIGARTFGSIEVKDGLKEGENIICEGIDKVKDGEKVMIAPGKGGV